MLNESDVSRFVNNISGYAFPFFILKNVLNIYNDTINVNLKIFHIEYFFIM